MATLRPAPDWLLKTTYAHRGLHSSDVPENSLAAAQLAIEAGLGIECDIQLSRSGTPFVFHDWDLDRLTVAKGRFGDREDSELATLSLRGSDQCPLPLTEFLARVGNRTPVLVEVKSLPDYPIEVSCERVCQALGSSDGQHAVMSFDPRVPQWFCEHSPATCRGLVGTDRLLNGFEHVWRLPDTLDRSRPDFLAIDRRDLARREAAVWRVAGKPLLSWTIKTKSQWNEASALADAMIAEGEALA